MAKGRRPRTKQMYDAIVEAFRKVGNKHTAVAALVGVDRSTVKRVYEYGWPQFEGCIPIKRMIELDEAFMRAQRLATEPDITTGRTPMEVLEATAKEVVEASPLVKEAAQRAIELENKARAALEMARERLAEVEKLAKARLDDAEAQRTHRLTLIDLEAKQKLADLLARAKVDAAETMADEANAAKFGRKAALSAAALAALVMKDAQAMAQQLRTAIGDLSKLSPNQAIRLAREMVRLVESSEKAVILALQAERLRVGQPTDVVGVQTLDSSLEEREIKLKAVQRALDRQKAKAMGLSVLEGGADATAATGTSDATSQASGVGQA